MEFFEKIRLRAAKSPRKIILSEGTDERVIKAAIEATFYNTGIMTLVGDEKKIIARLDRLLKDQKLNPDLRVSKYDISIVNPETSDFNETFAEYYLDCRKTKNFTKAEAKQLVKDPLIFSAISVKHSYADGTIGGAISTTTETVRTALQIIGLAENKQRLTSFFIMVFNSGTEEEKLFIFSDCGVTINPSTEDLANSAIISHDWYKLLIAQDPIVGMLSFSTLGSATHPLIRKIKNAKDLVNVKRPDVKIEGELQFDAAFLPQVAGLKAPNSSLAGTINIFIFPNLEAGNIAYKMAERLGGAVAVGPILDGLSKPANDVSRGCSSTDISNMVAITSVQAQNRGQS